MSFEWKSLLDLARAMEQEATKSGANAECLLRSAVGRSYFGAFCYARNYAAEFLKYQAKHDERDHGSLRAHLKGKRRHADAVRLERLRQWRNDADYLNNLPWADLNAVAATAIAEADKVFQSLTPPTSSTGS
jgi:hypothetical protein